MCCSSRKGRTPYQYTAASSPWNRHFLFGLWAAETLFGAFVCIFGGALTPYKYEPNTYDDGIASALYYILVFLVAGIVAFNLIFIVFQYLWFRKHKLHPVAMLSMECFNVLVWLAIVSLALYSLIEWTSKWRAYDAVELLCIFAAIPFAVHLWYSAVVYHRYRKNRRRSMDVEIQRRENAVNHE